MDNYIDVTLLPDSEFSVNILMNALYSKFHKALCSIGSISTGVSFPKFEITLGNILRIHGTESILHQLQTLNWIGAMNSYCHVTSIRSVPKMTKFRNISRKQPTMSEANLRRLIKRGSMQASEISHYRKKMGALELPNPYVILTSTSTGQKHPRYFSFGDILQQSIGGTFDQFGLSKTATIPWF